MALRLSERAGVVLIQLNLEMDFTIQEALSVADKRELGADAVFSISSAKLGNGVEQLRDNNLETYWQSDGVAPHCKELVVNCII